MCLSLLDKKGEAVTKTRIIVARARMVCVRDVITLSKICKFTVLAFIPRVLRSGGSPRGMITGKNDIPTITIIMVTILRIPD
jgi:hypothetical protein